MPDDYYVSQYSGEEIDERLTAAHNAVRYDAAQSLTDAQKAQARGNINAAPGGYGYGNSLIVEYFDDSDGSKFEQFVDSFIDGTSKVIRITNLADYPANICSGNSGFADIKIESNGNAIVNWYGPQDVVAGSSSGIYHAQKKRLMDGTWHPWEYTNPPMFLGVEYRTTERFLGKPVYVKVVDFGAMPNNTLKVVTFGDNTMMPVSAHGIMSGEYVIPGCTGSADYPTQEMQIFTAPGNVGIMTHVDRSDHTAVVIVKYWKTTD